MTRPPFLAQCTNIFEENRFTSEPRMFGADNVFISQDHSRKFYDTTTTSVVNKPLQPYTSYINSIMNNGGSYTTPNSSFPTFAQPRPVPGGVYFSFPKGNEYPHISNLNTTNNNYGIPQLEQSFINSALPQSYNVPCKTDCFYPPVNPPPFSLPREKPSKENVFKLQFHLQRSTSTSDLIENVQNSGKDFVDEKESFFRKLNDCNFWKDHQNKVQIQVNRVDTLSDTTRSNKLLRLSKTPDIKTKEGKYYEIDITHECDVCQNNISQTIHLLGTEQRVCSLKNGDNGENDSELKTKLNKKNCNEIGTFQKLEGELLRTNRILNENNSEKMGFEFSEIETQNSMSKINLNKKCFTDKINEKDKLLRTEKSYFVMKTFKYRIGVQKRDKYSECDVDEVIYDERLLKNTDLDHCFDSDVLIDDTSLKDSTSEKNESTGKREKRSHYDDDNEDDINQQKTKILRLSENEKCETKQKNENNNAENNCKKLNNMTYLESKNYVKDLIDDGDQREVFQIDEQFKKWDEILASKLLKFENNIKEVILSTKNFSINCVEINQHPANLFCNDKYVDKLIQSPAMSKENIQNNKENSKYNDDNKERDVIAKEHLKLNYISDNEEHIEPNILTKQGNVCDILKCDRPELCSSRCILDNSNSLIKQENIECCKNKNRELNFQQEIIEQQNQNRKSKAINFEDKICKEETEFKFNNENTLIVKPEKEKLQKNNQLYKFDCSSDKENNAMVEQALETVKDNKNKFPLFNKKNQEKHDVDEFQFPKSVIENIVENVCSVSNREQNKHKRISNLEKRKDTIHVVENQPKLTKTQSVKDNFKETLLNNEKSTFKKLEDFYKQIPRSFVRNGKELSRNSANTLMNLTKKLEYSNTNSNNTARKIISDHILSNCCVPSKNRNIPRSLLNNMSKSDIFLKTYDKSTREMENKLNEALKNYDNCLKIKKVSSCICSKLKKGLVSQLCLTNSQKNIVDKPNHLQQNNEVETSGNFTELLKEKQKIYHDLGIKYKTNNIGRQTNENSYDGGSKFSKQNKISNKHADTHLFDCNSNSNKKRESFKFSKPYRLLDDFDMSNFNFNSRRYSYVWSLDEGKHDNEKKNEEKL